MTGIVCPRCEKPMEGHDDAGCRRRISRRYFFGLAAGVVVAAQAASGRHADSAPFIGEETQTKVLDLKMGDTIAVKIAMTREFVFDRGLWTATMDFTALKKDGSRGQLARFVASSLEHPELGDKLAEAWAWDDWREKQKAEGGD